MTTIFRPRGGREARAVEVSPRPASGRVGNEGKSRGSRNPLRPAADRQVAGRATDQDALKSAQPAHRARLRDSTYFAVPGSGK